MAGVIAKLQIPRAALAVNVTDRQKLATAWKDLLTTSVSLHQSVRDPKKSSNPVIPEPQKAEREGITSYCFPLPFFTEGFMPSISISDKAWVMGTSPELNLRVAKAMGTPRTGKLLSGTVFAFNFAPALAMAKANIMLLEQMGIKPNHQMAATIFYALKDVQGIYGAKTTDGTKTRYRISLQMK